MSDVEKRDSDSGNSEERRVGDTKRENAHDALASLPDPDAGLSDEERAKLVSVCLATLGWLGEILMLTVRAILGPQAREETGFDAYPLVVFSVSGVLFGSDEYW